MSNKQQESYEDIFEKIAADQKKLQSALPNIVNQPDDQQRLYALIKYVTELTNNVMLIHDGQIEFANYSEDLLSKLK